MGSDDDGPSGQSSDIKIRMAAEKVLLYNRLDQSPQNIFLYLWAPTPSGARCPYIYVPDTIIIRHGRPVHWVYSSLRDGQIRMRKEECVGDKAFIHQHFCKTSPCYPNTVALHITAGQTMLQHASVEPISADTLLEMLDSEKGIADGLLQAYVEPFNDANEVLSVLWTRGSVEIERVSARKGWAKPKHGWAEHPIMEIGTQLNKRIRTVCDAMAKHVSQTSPQRYQLVSMRLIFKLDIHGKLWVMFCQHVSFNKASATPYMEDKATTTVSAKPGWLEKAKKTWETLIEPAEPSPRPEGQSVDGTDTPSVSGAAPADGAAPAPEGGAAPAEGGAPERRQTGELDSSADDEASDKSPGKPRTKRYDHPPPAYNPLQSLPGPRQLSASRREGLSRTYGPGESLSERRKRRETRQLTTAKNMLEYPATSLSHHARTLPPILMKALGLQRPWDSKGPSGPASLTAGLDAVSAERFSSVIPGTALKADYIRSPRRRAPAPPKEVPNPHLSKSAPDLLSAKAPDAVWMQNDPGTALFAKPAKPFKPRVKPKAQMCERGTSPGIPGSEREQAEALTQEL